MAELAVITKRLDFHLEQVQDFTPTPMTVATEAWYTQFESLEEALKTYPGIPMEKLCAFLEVSAKSPQKKLNMFLRWMIRRDSAVDLRMQKYRLIFN